MSFILGAAVFNVAPTILEVWKCVNYPPIMFGASGTLFSSAPSMLLPALPSKTLWL